MRYDPHCEDCGQSLLDRYGDDEDVFCASCEDDFKRLSDAGKLRMEGWALVVVKTEA